MKNFDRRLRLGRRPGAGGVIFGEGREEGMDRNEIIAATGYSLDKLAAEELGAMRISGDKAIGIALVEGDFSYYENFYGDICLISKSGSKPFRPHTSIDAAWGLLADDMRTETDEDDFVFSVWLTAPHKCDIRVVVNYADFPARNEARATAICRAWLLARLDR